MARAAALLAVLLALSAAGCEWGAEEDAAAPTVEETVTVVPIPDADPVVLDGDVEQTQAERPEGVDGHEDARDETPPGVDAEDVQSIVESRPAGIGPPIPLGGAENLNCPKRLVRNHSARASGSVVSMVVVHLTVSNPGTLGVIRGLFDTPSFGASSHIGLEGTGQCEQWVDYGRKAWTQGAFNSVAESVEIIAQPSAPRSWWMGQAIIRRGLLASWIADRLKARGLPARFVNPPGCTPVAGWTDHESLECGNTHTDVQPNFPYDVVKAQVLAHFQPTLRLMWQARSGGKLLFQQAAIAVGGVGGYDRLLAIMRGRGEATVKAAEKANGDVRIILVSVTS